MLKTIIKRDGSREDFTPAKLNMWGQWAARDLGNRVDWSEVVLEAVKACNEVTTSQELQNQLIQACILKRDWAHNCMAGKLYAVLYRKELYGNTIPTVKQLFNKMVSEGVMRDMGYTDQEFDQVEKIINHDLDFTYAQFQIKQVRKKYSLQNRHTNTEYETPQFTYMRMAMALSEKGTGESKLKDVEMYYRNLSLGRVNAPSPNYINLGTKLNGYASCCLYTVADDSESLRIGDYIANTMTCNSAGIGGYIDTRTIGDPIRGGLIEHSGKYGYYKSLGSTVKANMQAGRGGACTTYFSIFDPEAKVIARMQNPRTTDDKRNRDIHFCVMMNRLFAKKVASNKPIFSFTSFTAPDLVNLFFSEDQDGFEELYNKYDKDESFKKEYTSARELIILMTTQSYEVGTLYFLNIDEVNRHTPFKDKIYSSNLCVEITQPTKSYFDIRDLYLEEDHGRGEVSMCSIAGIVISNINSLEEYEEAAYVALKMTDKCIHLSDYPLPHVAYTAKQRLNSAVGILGLATVLARENLTYSSNEGKIRIHEIGERHAYCLIRASLRLGKELGNAPWINKTKWPQGWLPIDTYKKDVDLLVPPVYKFDWEELRREIIANGGIRNSCLVAHMPTESSSKASGAPNSIYPIRDLALKKSDANNIIDWVPTDNDIIGHQYQLAWTVSSKDMIEVYAIFQKFADHTISADLYKDRRADPNLSTTEMISEYLHMVKYGVKSRYYQNSLTSKEQDDVEKIPVFNPLTLNLNFNQEERGCASGSCTL